MKTLKNLLLLLGAIMLVTIMSCQDDEQPPIDDTQSDPCASIICQNNGTCISGTCECEPGFSGTNCQIDACVGVVCYNGGDCVAGNCNCPPGYTGSQCQTPICSGVTCVNGQLNASCDCICDNGWTGDDCSEQLSSEISFLPADLENVCPDHIGGDREFAGNGPQVTISCTAYTVNDKDIYVDIYFHLLETYPNGTEGLYDGSIKIYTAPNGKKIERIISDTQSTANYTDYDILFDYPTIIGELVDSFKSMGDTGGNDLGQCIQDSDAELNIYFNPMTIELVDE